MIRNGGTLIGERLAAAGVRHMFTLCGGHISPILVAAKEMGIHVCDVRDEGHAVFAADAVARMTGIPGVAAVTAGPGVTNTLTAVKNAEMAQSPVLILGGATPTVLKGRGALQDIDQLSMMRPITKWATSVARVQALGPTIDKALRIAREGVPGPVFVEVPVDLLYPEEIVRGWYIKEAGLEDAKGVAAKALGLYVKAHLARQFQAPHLGIDVPTPPVRDVVANTLGDVAQVAAKVRAAQRPVLVIGSQALVNYTPEQAAQLAEAVTALGIPTFLGGMARGLLGATSPIQFRHQRGHALKKADLVIIAGFPFDFRLGYGQKITRKGTLVSVNLSLKDLYKNRRPDIGVLQHPGDFLRELAGAVGEPPRGAWDAWFETTRGLERDRDAEIAKQAAEPAADGLVNPIDFFLKLDAKLDDNAVLVVDGGDFVATGAYTLRPRSPQSWLDPGVFGTLGVGGGFAVGAALCRPGAETWLIYGDGSSAYSLSEFDTCVRHGLAPIAVIGTDGAWAQIAREQVEMLGDDVGTTLLRTDYHKVAEGYGGVGIVVKRPEDVDAALDEARAIARSGRPVCVNVHIAKSDFRKGSISM